MSLTQTSIAEPSIKLAVWNFVHIRRDRLAVQCFKPGLIWQSKSWVTTCFVGIVHLQDLFNFHSQTFEDRNFKLCHDLWYDVEHTWPTFWKNISSLTPKTDLKTKVPEIIFRQFGGEYQNLVQFHQVVEELLISEVNQSGLVTPSSGRRATFAHAGKGLLRYQV